MAWVRKMFREGKVWAETDAAGELVVNRGVVKIRYREDDEREYSAKASEIQEISASRLAAAQARKKAKTRKKKAAARKAKTKGTADAPDNTIVVYTDGSCYGNPGPAGLGVLLEWKGKTREASVYLGEGTNNIAELEAIRHALQLIRRRDLPVRLYTDSAYAIGVLVGGWKAKENVELIESIRRLLPRFADLQLCKVKGHAGDPRNERVDQLARDAIDQRSR